MKKVIFLFFMIVSLQILDGSIVGNFAVFGYRPSLLFVYIVCYSIICGKEEAFFIAIIAGAFQDLYYLNAFGLNMLTNMIACILAGIIGENLFTDKKTIPIVIVFVSSLIKELMILFLLFINRYNKPLQDGFFTSLYNLALAYFMYSLVLRVSKFSFMVRKWRF